MIQSLRYAKRSGVSKTVKMDMSVRRSTKQQTSNQRRERRRDLSCPHHFLPDFFGNAKLEL